MLHLQRRGFWISALVVLGSYAQQRKFRWQHLPNPGAFYACITAGLGKPLGLGASFLAVVSYFFILVGGYAFGGISLEALVTDVLGGPEVPWWAYTLLLMTIVGTLGYFKITLSAKILTVSMIFEVILMVAFDVAAFINGGPEGITTAPFEPANMLSGTSGSPSSLALSATPGSKPPLSSARKPVARKRQCHGATYIAILSMGSIYALTAWAQIIAIGPGTVVEASATDPTGTVMTVVSQLLGKIVMDVMIVLLCSSIFAANLATHNISARYLYSLSVDRVFPAALSRVHSRHDSPPRCVPGHQRDRGDLPGNRRDRGSPGRNTLCGPRRSRRLCPDPPAHPHQRSRRPLLPQTARTQGQPLEEPGCTRRCDAGSHRRRRPRHPEHRSDDRR